MNPRRAKALQLRMQGYSYNEIQKEIGISKSTLSLWLRDVILSDQARQRLQKRVAQGVLNGLVKRNKLQTQLAWKRAEQIRRNAKQNIGSLNIHDLLIVGAALYWAEGYKRPKIRDGKPQPSHVVSFVNSDPEMIRLFIEFLKTCLSVSANEITLCMRLYAHINEQEAQRYWVKVTGLPRTSFRRTTYLVSNASKFRRPYNRLPYGTLQVQVLQTQKFHQLMGYIDGVKESKQYDTVLPVGLGSSVS